MMPLLLKSILLLSMKGMSSEAPYIKIKNLPSNPLINIIAKADSSSGKYKDSEQREREQRQKGL